MSKVYSSIIMVGGPCTSLRFFVEPGGLYIVSCVIRDKIKQLDYLQ